ncbi:MAG: hypothetical protein ACXVCK_07365 [Bdellovibrionota bacterium]
MRFKNKILTVITTIGLLSLAGSGCSSDDKGSAATAALCAQLNAKQGELDCKVAALSTNCAANDTACMNTKAVCHEGPLRVTLPVFGASV